MLLRSQRALLTSIGASTALVTIVAAQPNPSSPNSFPPNVTLESLSLLSGPPYIGGFKGLFGFEPGSPEDSISRAESPSAPEAEAEEEAFALATTPLFTVAVNDDTQADVETTIISNLTTNATSVGYIKRVAPGITFRNYIGHTTDFTSWSNFQLSIPAGYACTADPLQHANVFDNGIAPRRTYLAGIVYNKLGSDCSPVVRPNAIGVWRSDNGGASWSGPTLVAVNSNNSAIFLDKPDVEVAWYTTTRGRAYVAYVEVDISGAPTDSKIFVARSTDGGVSFSTPVWVASAMGRYQGPQMLASTVGTRIYVLWSDYTDPLNERLLMSWSDNQGVSWTAPEVVATGNLLTGAPADFLNGGVRASTLSMARYNGVRNAIGVVWHERVADGTTDIYFATKTTSGWQPKKRINPVTTKDQFMPALDYDTSGNYLVTYYDRSGDSMNIKYREKWVKIDYLGNILESGEVASGFESDPTLFPATFMGDYQDVWWWSFSDVWGDRFNGAWVGRPAANVNPYVSGIQ